MTTVMTGTLIDGVVKLDETVNLPDNSRVSVSIEPIDHDPDKAKAALESFLKRADQRDFNSAGIRFTRDELHERR